MNLTIKQTSPIKLLFFSILLFSLVSCSNDNALHNSPSWEIINDKEYNGLTNIEFHNDDFGIISGSLGTLLKTENGGEDWQELNVGLDHSFVTTFILNENEFFTSRRGLYKTDDNGVSFTELSGLSNNGSTISAIHFFDSNNGIITQGGSILKTTDGGQAWDVKYRNINANSMQFVSTDVGFIYGGFTSAGTTTGELYLSVDGGNTWNQGDVQTSEIMSLYFLNEKLGYFSNFENQFLRSRDGGLNWDIIGKSPITFRDIVFLTENVGYGVGYHSIYKTENGGETWVKDYENNTMIFSSIAKTPNGQLFTVTSNGTILRKK